MCSFSCASFLCLPSFLSSFLCISRGVNGNDTSRDPEKVGTGNVRPTLSLQLPHVVIKKVARVLEVDPRPLYRKDDSLQLLCPHRWHCFVWVWEQVPVFFLRDESGAVHVEGKEGLLFMSPEDAKAKLEELKGADGAKVE